MKSRINSLRPLGLALSLLLSGCMVGPDYHRPATAALPQYHERAGWQPAAPAAAAPKGDWWKDFHDPLLDQLEPQVASANQSVAEAYANYRAALADVKVARSSLFPTIGIDSTGTRARTSSATYSNKQGVSNSGTLEGELSWSPDFWGSVRRTINEDKATAQADKATLANTVLTEQVALATAVIDLRVNDADIELLKQTVAAYQKYLDVISDQDQAGTVAPSDVITARTQLESAQASLIELGVARAQYSHAIAVLVGKNPGEIEIETQNGLPQLPDVPVGVPSALLQRRPDIAVAEREMAAANEAIGIAIAAYYPTISLTAVDGFSQSPLAGLLKLANHVWSAGAEVSETVFDGGERSGTVAAAKASYAASVANYRQTVLTAFQNVEDDLSNLRILGQQQQALDATVTDARRGAEIAFNEYQAGTEDYTTVATALATQLSAEQTRLGVIQSRLVDTVTLIGDLGGGWSTQALDDKH
ncbi:efflux transporter outer membrane subunit [Frateuria aurantia]